MAQLGSGNSSDYPGSIDTQQVFVNGSNPAADSTSRIDAELVNDALDAIIAIETELGTDPAGSFASVTARLAPLASGGHVILANDALFAWGDVGTGLSGNASTDVITLATAGTERMRVNAAGVVFVGDTTNANMTGGLTISQGAADDEIIALKSSDVVHAMTNLAEADTYGTLSKAVAASGGINLTGYSASVVGLGLTPRATAEDTTDATGSQGNLDIVCQLRTGATAGAHAAGANLLSVRNDATCRFLVKGNGDLHATNATITALDHYDDAQLVRAFELARAPDSVIRSRWDDYVRYNEQDLIDAGILGDTIANGGLWCITQHLRLLNGAIHQLNCTMHEQREQIATLEARLLP